MKKFLCIICLIITSTASADNTAVATETCANEAGTIITGAVTEYKYCLSKSFMDWFNAMSWCDALGRQLFSLSECKCSNTVSDCREICPELIGSNVNSAWTQTRLTTSLSAHAIVHLQTGTIKDYSLHHNFHRALCK